VRGWRVTLVASVPRHLPRPLPAVFWAVVVGFGLLSLAIAVQFPGATNAGRSVEAAAATVLAGSALIGAGLYLSFGWHRPVSGALFGLAACAWSLQEWNNPATGVGAAFTIGLVGQALAPAVVAHAVLAYPLGRLLSRSERLVVAVAYVDTLLVLGLLPTLFFAPAAHGCHLCPSNLLLAGDSPQLYDGLNGLGRWLLVGWTSAFVAVAVRRLLRSSGPIPRVTGPVLVTGAAYALLVLAADAQAAAPGLAFTSPREPGLWFAEAAALCAIGLAVGWSWLLRRRTRSQMAGLVVELAKSPPPGGLQEMLGQTLGDSGLRVAYALDGREELVDANGKAVDLSGGQGQTPLAREDRTIALLLHRPGLLDDAAVVEEVAAATRLALDNERFHAEVLARIEELRASRSRIVAAGDAERRRLERDLHDGAQQRLLGLSLALGFTRAQVKESADSTVLLLIDDAEERLRGVIHELREVAHGIYPAVLSSDGLAAAVDALRERASIPINVTSLTQERLPGLVESAAYFLIAEVTGPVAIHAGASRATVDANVVGNVLMILVSVDGADSLDAQLDGRFVDLEDRVGALGGQLRVEHDELARLTVRAEIPCAS
jgi:signal transduction histidine kinase